MSERIKSEWKSQQDVPGNHLHDEELGGGGRKQNLVPDTNAGFT